MKKISGNFIPLYFFHTAHLWHGAPHSLGSWYPPHPSAGSLLQLWGRLVPRVAQLSSAHPWSNSLLETAETGLVWIKTEAVSGWEKLIDKASPSTCQSIKLNTQTSGQPWKPSTVIYTNTVIFPRCCLREADPRCYLLNNYPISQGRSSLQLLHWGPGGLLWRLLRAALCHRRLTEHIEIAAPCVPASKTDNCIKSWFYFFFFPSSFLLGEIE